MTISTLQNVIELNQDHLGFAPGNYSLFAPTKDSGDPLEVSVLRGRFSPLDFADIFWCASLSDDEIDEIATLECEARDLAYQSLLETIVA